MLRRRIRPTVTAVLGTLSLLAAMSPFDAPGVASAAAPSASCVNGWIAPAPGSAEYEEGLGILSDYFGLSGLVEVAEIRYFTGPEVPWIFDPPWDSVRRWYVKVSLVEDPHWRGRFILEWRADDIKGVSAAAPYETTGYRSPDWRAFVGDGPFVEVPGLPGLWAGIQFDFVTGEGDSGNPGLPDEVVGCLGAALPATR